MQREFDILAHRTCCGNCPPNSIRGLLKAWSCGAARVECDITFSKDGEPFIWSDDMNRFLGGARLKNLTSAEIGLLRRFDCGEKVLRIDEVWKFLSENSGISVAFDVKYYGCDMAGHFRKISEEILALSFKKIIKPTLDLSIGDRIGFVTFAGGLDLLRLTRTAAPRMSTDLIVVSPRWSLPNRDKKGLVCPLYLTLGWKKFNHWKYFPESAARIVREAKMNGLRVYAGLVSNEKDLRWAWDRGFDGVWVDNISWAFPAIGKIKEVNR